MTKRDQIAALVGEEATGLVFHGVHWYRVGALAIFRLASGSSWWRYFCVSPTSCSGLATSWSSAAPAESPFFGVGAIAGATIVALSAPTLTTAARVPGSLGAPADNLAWAAHHLTACRGGSLGLAGAGFGLGVLALAFFGAVVGLSGIGLDLVLGGAGLNVSPRVSAQNVAGVSPC